MFPAFIHVCTLASSYVGEGGDENSEYMNISTVHCLENAELSFCILCRHMGGWRIHWQAFVVTVMNHCIT
jgi:hypothetical protein